MNHVQNPTPLEHQRLLQLAREYRHRGYNVTLHPSPDDLPPDLADCAFDLIAQRKNKVIAVEVRSRENLTLNGPQDLQRMTNRVHQMPGWELELVVTNPRRKAC
jgi:Holliday junction resolvase